MPAVDPGLFRRVTGCFATGVAVVSCLRGGQMAGITVNTLVQAFRPASAAKATPELAPAPLENVEKRRKTLHYRYAEILHLSLMQGKTKRYIDGMEVASLSGVRVVFDWSELR